MIREILKTPSIELLKPSLPIDVGYDPKELASLILDLKDTLKKPHGKLRGVGVAAPQIGVHRRVIVINYNSLDNFVMINPEIIEATGTLKHLEMCLSTPGLMVRKKRKQAVKVQFLDERLNLQTQTFFALEAFIIQHEIDHLDGNILTIEDA